MNSIDANQPVCHRCQMPVSVVAAPVRQKRSLWFSRRGNLGVGGSIYFTPGKHVCSFCGSGNLVPAGSPKGLKILQPTGLTVTGRLSPPKTRLGCLPLIFLGGMILVGWAYFRPDPTPPPAPPTISPADVLRKKEADDRASGVAQALKFNQDAAARGDAYGELRMGERYRDGDGVKKDLAKAREYFTKSAAQGDPEAQKNLNNLP